MTVRVADEVPDGVHRGVYVGLLCRELLHASQILARPASSVRGAPMSAASASVAVPAPVDRSRVGVIFAGLMLVLLLAASAGSVRSSPANGRSVRPCNESPT